MKKLFHPITNHGLSELCFHGLFRSHYSTFIGFPIWDLLISLFSNEHFHIQLRIEMFAILCTSYDFCLVIFSHVDFSKNLIV